MSNMSAHFKVMQSATPHTHTHTQVSVFCLFGGLKNPSRFRHTHKHYYSPPTHFARFARALLCIGRLRFKKGSRHRETNAIVSFAIV